MTKNGPLLNIFWKQLKRLLGMFFGMLIPNLTPKCSLDVVFRQYWSLIADKMANFRQKMMGNRYEEHLVWFWASSFQICGWNPMHIWFSVKKSPNGPKNGQFSNIIILETDVKGTRHGLGYPDSNLMSKWTAAHPLFSVYYNLHAPYSFEFKRFPLCRLLEFKFCLK